MTEQEAEAWVAKLTRIWALDPPVPGAEWHRLPDGALGLNLTSEVSIALYHLHLGTPNPLLTWKNCDLSWEDGEVIVTCAYRPRNPSEDGYPFLEEFEEQWMDFFRRGCWLSGLPVEASAHEKAEWIQGFTPEELQAWNLKM